MDTVLGVVSARIETSHMSANSLSLIDSQFTVLGTLFTT